MNLESWLYAHTSLLLTVSSEAALAFSGVTYPPACKRIRDSVFTDGFMAKGHQLFRRTLPTGWPDNHRFPSACSERGTVLMPELTSKVSVLLANAPLTGTWHGRTQIQGVEKQTPHDGTGGRRDVRICYHFCYHLSPAPSPVGPEKLLASVPHLRCGN